MLVQWRGMVQYQYDILGKGASDVGDVVGKAARLVTHAGVMSSIPGFFSLSYETLNQGPHLSMT